MNLLEQFLRWLDSFEDDLDQITLESTNEFERTRNVRNYIRANFKGSHMPVRCTRFWRMRNAARR